MIFLQVSLEKKPMDLANVVFLKGEIKVTPLVWYIFILLQIDESH